MAEFNRERQTISADDVLLALARGDDISLVKCKIDGPLDVNRYFLAENGVDNVSLLFQELKDTTVITFTQKISFDNCEFCDDVVFASSWTKQGQIKVVFKQNLSFNSSVFSGQARFSLAKMEGHSSFDGCEFKGVVCFRKAMFLSTAMFRTVNFIGYGLFNHCSFAREARFSSTFFSKGVNFSGVSFLGKTDFAGVYAGSKTVPIYNDVKFALRYRGDDETFWRFIKQCAQESGHYRLSGECFYREQCAHYWVKLFGAKYDSLGWFRKIGRQIWGLRLLPEFVFGRALFGYGERPIRVLISSLLLIVLCAMGYWQNEAVLLRGEQMVDGGFLDYLYFSVTTFATLGLGDMYPVRDSLCRSMVIFEVLSGACLMSLFVVSLAKRFSRS